MTKQEEIREGIAERCYENCEGATQEQCDKSNSQHEGIDACRYCGADQVLAYLHSQGVVITSDKQDWTDDNNRHRRRIVEPLINKGG